MNFYYLKIITISLLIPMSTNVNASESMTGVDYSKSLFKKEYREFRNSLENHKYKKKQFSFLLLRVTYTVRLWY